tara:strand:+ start:120 stop:1277 length:1158 start_codon:yes stop_codon:yes gene_type:complete
MRPAPTADHRRLPFLRLDLGTHRTAPVAAAPFLPVRNDEHEQRPQPNLQYPDLGLDDGLEMVGRAEDQYSVDQVGEACWRVLCFNPPRGKTDAIKASIAKMRREFSLLGENGHIERANAATHLLGAVLFAIFAAVRAPSGLDSSSTTGQLCTVSSVLVVVVMAVSTAYHTLSTVRELSPWVRMGDHGAIYISLGVATTTDAAIATLNFEDVPWQCMLDGALVAAVLLAFFLFRRMVLDPSWTEIGWGSCRMGLFRYQHSDFAYGATRSAGYLILSTTPVLISGTAHRNLESDAFLAVFLANTVSLGLLIAGLLLDNVLIWPDSLYAKLAERRGVKEALKPPWCIPMHSQRIGCICSSHSLWHVLSLIAVIVQTAGREYALGTLDL